MALEHLIKIPRDHFKIQEPSDWCNIRPEWIRMLDGVGPKCLDQIRVYLALRGLTLKDDGTVDFWMRHLKTAKVGGQISLIDTATTEAFTILIDAQEKQPWTFQGFVEKGQPIIQPIRWQSLGPSHGDYTVAGGERYVHVERKSVDDAIGTFLAHGERRERWERTLQFLAEIPYGHVIIEGSEGRCYATMQARGARSLAALRNEFMGSVLSWSDTYQIPFWFVDSTRLAEVKARRILKRGWLKATEQKQRPVSDIESLIADLT